MLARRSEPSTAHRAFLVTAAVVLLAGCGRTSAVLASSPDAVAVSPETADAAGDFAPNIIIPVDVVKPPLQDAYFSCGNGVVDPGEACDDGNVVSGDGCSADCRTVESGWRCPEAGRACSPICGDGIVAGRETCDDGNTQSGDGCSNICLTEPGWDCSGGTCVRSSFDGGLEPDGRQAVCGDGIMSGAEECDDGPMNSDSTYGGCTTRCTLGPHCGDGTVDQGEECDLGDLNGKPVIFTDVTDGGTWTVVGNPLGLVWCYPDCRRGQPLCEPCAGLDCAYCD